MTILYSDKEVKIYEPSEVFELCINRGHVWVKDQMYMHSEDEHTHFFKDKITRKYTKVSLF